MKNLIHNYLISVIARLDRAIQRDMNWILRSSWRMTLCSAGLFLSLGLLAGCASQTPLLEAITAGNIETMKTLLDQGADIYDENGNRDWCWGPLQCAIYKDRFEAAILLLDSGINPNKTILTGFAGETPLIYAGRLARLSIANLLIAKGADLEYALTYCEQHSIDFAAGGGYKNCVATLKSIKAKRDEAKKPAKSQDISEEKLAAMVQTAVEKSSKEQKKEAKVATISDIDKPSFITSDKITGDNDLAVIIGIEGYQNIPKSDFSFDDAKLVKEYIKALGFKERNIELITDEKATKSSIEKSLEAWLKNKAKADSRVFVYYSGHGAPDPQTGEAYLVPYDGDPNYLAVTGYPLKRLYENLGKLQVAEVTVVLDSCFSGAGGRSVLAQGARPLVMMADIKTIPINMAILSATQGSQISTSSPEKGHGIFTYYFLKALKEGKKNMAEIYSYIKPLVEDEAKQLNVQQSPSISPEVEKLKGRFGLRK